MKTFIATKKNTDAAKKDWFLADAKGKILGRLAAKIATVIRGKHKATYTPNFDAGDRVVVINADKIKVTGNKLKEKMYMKYSGYPGGLKKTSFEVMLNTKPTEVLKTAVRKMLPANPLSRDMIKKLYIFAGESHPYKKIVFKKLEA
ncbi:MAG: 50S ribosomal protein L13 [Candidatus Omnitrophica bacterium CG1_02_44_16]|nr:MAG: 50S ribosomal protein L13 [Candidatus Omnitrophica bacterium CG1_02_44_16]PIY82079.1 MAG: 50S ribosomal protein L13 [Candidatus Omnitrophica bacterium CG_4_10_14_0_8_um_filter_44_12]PIZ83266.1 MAG: 50S ribosomal protein L13 [Candidatus Omnitrophica bacterium CG_4_10_14_0_2_um_filter_44_9]